MQPEQLLGPLDGQLLNGINVLTTAVIPLAGQTLGVFVGEHGTLGLHHRTGGKVLRCDEFQVGFLTLPFLIDERGDIRIRLSQISVDGAPRSLAHEMSVKLCPIVRNRIDHPDQSTKKKLPLGAVEMGAVETRLERFELPTL